MALIKCPECGRDVSNAAASCPFCGYPIREANNKTIRIHITDAPDGGAYYVRVFNAKTDEMITETRAGSIAEFESNEDIEIYFKTRVGGKWLTTTVSPKNGGRYRATWEIGWLTPKMGLSQNLCKLQRSSAKRESVKSERAAEPSDVRLCAS